MTRLLKDHPLPWSFTNIDEPMTDANGNVINPPYDLLRQLILSLHLQHAELVSLRVHVQTLMN